MAVFKAGYNINKTCDEPYFNHYFSWLFNLSMTIYQWIGLPDVIPFYYPEMLLANKGAIALYESKNEGLICCYAIPSGNFTIYNLPDKWTLATPSSAFTTREVSIKDENVAIIFNDFELRPMIYSIALYAYELSKIRSIAGININSLRHPVALTGTKDQSVTLKKLFDQFSNSPAFLPLDSLDFEAAFKAIDLKVQSHVNDLQYYFTCIFNEALTYIGINNNPNQPKKERLVTDEVDANNELIGYSMHSRLMFRQEPLIRFNKNNGYSISCIKREVNEIGGNDSITANDSGVPDL